MLHATLAFVAVGVFCSMHHLGASKSQIYQISETTLSSGNHQDTWSFTTNSQTLGMILENTVEEFRTNKSKQTKLTSLLGELELLNRSQNFLQIPGAGNNKNQGEI